MMMLTVMDDEGDDDDDEEDGLVNFEYFFELGLTFRVIV